MHNHHSPRPEGNQGIAYDFALLLAPDSTIATMPARCGLGLTFTLDRTMQRIDTGSPIHTNAWGEQERIPERLLASARMAGALIGRLPGTIENVELDFIPPMDMQPPFGQTAVRGALRAAEQAAFLQLIEEAVALDETSGSTTSLLVRGKLHETDHSFRALMAVQS